MQLLAIFLISPDRSGALKSKINFIEAAEQAMLPERIDLETEAVLEPCRQLAINHARNGLTTINAGETFVIHSH